MHRTAYVIITEKSTPNIYGAFNVQISRYFQRPDGSWRDSTKEFEVSEKRARTIQHILEKGWPLIMELDGGQIKLIGKIEHSR